MGMYATFYIANVAASGNVIPNASLPNNQVILPANAVVTSVSVTSTGTGNINVGFTPLSMIGPGQNPTLGTAIPTALLSNASSATRTVFAVGGANTGAYLGNVANATNVVVVTSAANGTASGSVSGYIHYFISDNGTQQT
jgi:hypothetical protein